MNKNIFFVAGIHGVGKSYFCKDVSRKLGIKHYSASELIKLIKSELVKANKKVSDIGGNQDVLITAIERHVKETTILLDGHFCLFDSENKTQKIPLDVFNSLNPKAILVIQDDVKKILNRIADRDSLEHNEELFDELQVSEISHAKTVSECINIPLYQQVAGTANEDFITLIRKMMEENAG